MTVDMNVLLTDGISCDALELCLTAKRKCEERNLPEAYRAWCSIYEIFRNNTVKYHVCMSLFSDEEVHALVDYANKESE